jgi:ABC-2 type transport system permease protein
MTGGTLGRARSTLDVVVESARVQLRSQRSPALVVLGVVQPAALVLVTLLARSGGSRVSVADAALGTGLISLWGVTLWQGGQVLRGERWQGTLGAIVARPAGIVPVLVGKSLASTLAAVLVIAPTVVVASLAAGEPIPVHRPAPFVLALLALLASATVLGILLSCVFVVTRAAPRIAEALGYPIFILGGLLVPLALLPHWVRPLSAVVSLRWGGELLRSAAHGAPQRAVDWSMLTATTLAYAALAGTFLGRVVDRARREGSLDLY